MAAAGVGMEEAVSAGATVLAEEAILGAAISEAEDGAGVGVLDAAITEEDTMAARITAATMAGPIPETLTMTVILLTDTPLPTMAARLVLAATPGAGAAGTDRPDVVGTGTADGTALHDRKVRLERRTGMSALRY
jgi:hypothetical protein